MRATAAGGPSLDESDVGRRRRRRRRRRGGERSFGENLPQDAPQPTDDGLAVVAEIGGDLQAPSGEVNAFDRRGPRSGRRPRSSLETFARPAKSFLSAIGRRNHARNERRQASTRPPRSRSRKNSPHPKQTIPKLRRPPATRPPPERRLPSRREPRLMKPASSRRRSPRLRSMMSRSPRPLPARRQPLALCARGGQHHR